MEVNGRKGKILPGKSSINGLTVSIKFGCGARFTSLYTLAG
jgi:hypothetical protein